MGRSLRSVFIVFASVVVLFLASAAIAPGLIGLESLRTVLLLACFVVIAGFGQGMVILLGGLDLSVGSVVTLGGVLLSGFVPQNDAHIFWAVPLVLCICTVVGILNGVGVTILRIPAFVMTLATGIIVESGVLEFTQGAPAANSAPSWVAALSNDYILGIPWLVWGTIIFVAVGAAVQDLSVVGRIVHCLGANPRAANIAGLRSRLFTVICYGVAGLCSGVCGCLYLGFIGAPTLSMGQPFTIESIAAVVVGGSSILGGVGTYLGTVGGALFLGVVSNDITALGMGAGWRTFVEGAVIIGALMLFAFSGREGGTMSFAIKQWARSLVFGRRNSVNDGPEGRVR